MITYFYWIVLLAIIISILFFIGYKLEQWKYALIAAAVTFVVGWTAYYFYFQQIFVKKYGGVMSLTVPAGQRHIGATWKDENLWIENYDPKTNTCFFNEYSRGNMLQGKVIIQNCNPLMPQN
ncbi:hypothetical protein MNBD_GAMMA22-102 [hydrothermal vent metagenome]|uniref:Uncharacterized protein n=1 Tax=hydrothermal vent metagenome TaxID=652676 RepID=A0A3B1B5E5_9ZZZZ